MKSSFPPIINSLSKFLILGSLPGEESIRQQKYYAHPRNLFWPIISAVFETELPEDYESKIGFLLKNRIALWDVIERAERDGSLDSHIKNEKPNDFEGLLGKFPNIHLILFNGQKAEKSFHKYVLPVQNLPVTKLIYLPSTSPANASMSMAERVSSWSILKHG